MNIIRERISPNEYTMLNLDINIDANKEPEHDNVFWYGGNVADIKSSQGEYIIAARGVVFCNLIAKKDYVNELGEKIKKGTIIASVKDKNEYAVFKEVMSSYIKDDNELSDILLGNHDIYEMDIHNNNWFELSFCDKNGEIEYDDVMDADTLKEAMNEALDIIWEQNKNNKLYSIYCRTDSSNKNETTNIIDNQIKTCLSSINKTAKENTELIRVYFDTCSGAVNHNHTFGKVLADLKNDKIIDLYSTNISRLSRDVRRMIDIREILKNSKSDIYLSSENKYVYKQIFNEMTIPDFYKKTDKEIAEEQEMDEIEYE